MLFAFSLVVSLVTFAFWKVVWLGKDLDATEFFVLLVFALACTGALPFIYRAARIDISHFRRKEWFGTTFLHFIFWLGFTLLLANPPFSDNAPPAIDAFATPSVQGVGGVVQFAAYIGDNEGIDASSLRFCLGPGSQETCDPVEWVQVQDKPIWIHQWTPTAEGNYTYTIEARDVNGKLTTFRGTVLVGNPLPKISPVSDTTFRDDSTRIRVRPHESLDLRAVMYQIDGRLYNMTPPRDAGGDWETDPTFPGWKVGTLNVTFVAQEQPRFLHAPGLSQGHYRLDGGLARHPNASRTYTIAAGFQDLNHEQEPRPPQNQAPNVIGTPGLGMPMLLVGAVVAVALVARRHRHERR